MVGTYNGLAEFDGDRSKVLDASNTEGLSDSRITALHDDPDGVVWIEHDRDKLTRCVDGRFEPVVLDRCYDCRGRPQGPGDHGGLGEPRRGIALRQRSWIRGGRAGTIPARRTQVVLLDINLPGMSGVKCVRQ